MGIKEYIDTKFNLNKITSVTTHQAERTNKTDIYLIDEQNAKHKINANIVVQGTNSSGKGTIIAINHTGAIYLEHLGYYEELSRLLDNIKDFMQSVATKPLGNAPAGVQGGPVVTTPALIQQATKINEQIETLKRGLP